MAALTPAQIELANSLTQDELPTKLRCAICSKLAINAFRLPCCETAICENCQSTLPSSCPVCEHSPVSGDDCTIYKSLRTTIRVFLKTEEKKREAARPKSNVSAPPTPVEATPTPTPTATKPPTDASSADNTASIKTEEVAVEAPAEQQSAVVETQADASILPEQGAGIPDQDPSAADQSGDHGAANEQAEALLPNGQVDDESQQVENGSEDPELAEAQDPDDQTGAGFGQDSMNGNFNGMNFGGGDMNQMQMMMAMQNGMNPAAFGSFPMMGMGMGMDPVAMQNMYMNGGFGAQGMGMNSGMNMNMGMNGWDGQQSWNMGQDNFNPNATGMGNGDFGNFNSGFRNGYNSGNYGHNNQFNDFGRGGYGYRARGRGRGFNRGFGRGFNQGYGGLRHQGQQMWPQEIAQYPGGNDTQPSGHDYSENPGEGQKSIKTDEFGRTVRPDQEGALEQNGPLEAEDGSTGQVPTNNAAHPGEAHDDATVENGDVSSADPYVRPYGSSYGTGSMPPPTAAPTVPVNAPTGPKAMRQGLPNTSTIHLRARGFIQEESLSVTNTSMVASPVQEEHPVSRSSSRFSRKDADRRHSERGRDGEHDKDQDRSKDHGKDHDRSRSYSRSRSRSRSKDRKESRRHRRHRSESATGDDREDESRRRKHRSRRPGREDDEDNKSRSRDEKHESRSRSGSPDRDREHKRSSRRSHRERDKGRDKEDLESDREHRKKSSHRSYHDHERERDRDRDKNRDKERRKDRDRERDREHRHRGYKTSTDTLPPAESSQADFNPPTGPRGSLAVKGNSSSANELAIRGTSGKSSSHRREGASSSSRRPSVDAPKGPSGGSAKDPHTLEREARDRERLLKEAQRMAGLAGKVGAKRSRDSGDDRGGRRKSRRGETVYGDEEERMRRLEAEREGDRWD